MIDNCFTPAFEARGTTVNKWGKDQTGLREYRFNNSGFRSNFEYTTSPEYAIFGASVVLVLACHWNKLFAVYFQVAKTMD